MASSAADRRKSAVEGAWVVSKTKRMREVFEVTVLSGDGAVMTIVDWDGYNFRIPSQRIWKPDEKLKLTIERLVPAKRNQKGGAE